MTSVGTVISYPISAYQNVPIQANFYNPSQFFISDVQLGQTTTVTATTNMNYVIGQQIRLLIPAASGCFQLNNLTGYVLSIPDTDQVEVSIDSSQNVNQFVSSSAKTQPQIVAIGDINSGILSSNGPNISSTNIPGAFINISPE